MNYSVTRLFSFLLILCIFSSCKKSKEKYTALIASPIFYTDLVPDLGFHTILQFEVSINPYCNPFPTPVDSSVNYLLDLDNDSIDDYRFELSHFPEYCSGHCGSANLMNLVVRPLNANAYLSIDTIYPVHVRAYDTTQVISQLDKWINYSRDALIEGGCTWPNVGFTDAYFGLMVNSRLGYIHIERTALNGILIKEYAISRTQVSQIIPGER